jgi:acyl-CoA dehydrogenase
MPPLTKQAAALAAELVPVLAEHAADVDRGGRFPTEAMTAIRESDLMGLLVPERYGGLGGDLAALADIAGRLAAGCLSTAMIWAMHCQQVDTIARYGTAELRDTLLPRIAAGEVYVASVTTEQGKGGHLLTASAPLVPRGDGLAFDRMAPVVTGGLHADGYLITMREHEDAQPQRVSMVYAERDRVAVTQLGGWHALGMRGTESVPLRITGEVPATHLVGEAGGFRRAAVESFVPAGHIGWVACWLGAARGAFADLVTVLRSAGRPATVDPHSDLVAERLARARMSLELVSAYLGRVVADVDQARADGTSLEPAATQIHLNLLKVIGAELTYDSIERLVTLVGMRLGYLTGSPVPLERHLRDLRAASLNYANDRLLVATGTLAWLDRAIDLA